MNAFADGVFVKFLSDFGLPGILLIIWWLSDREHGKTLQAYREDTVKMHQAVMEVVKAAELRYESNVVLVKNYEKMAGGLESLIVLNTQTITRLCDSLKCPVDGPR